jgi:hypothetical protein
MITFGQTDHAWRHARKHGYRQRTVPRTELAATDKVCTTLGVLGSALLASPTHPFVLQVGSEPSQMQNPTQSPIATAKLETSAISSNLASRLCYAILEHTLYLNGQLPL